MIAADNRTRTQLGPPMVVAGVGFASAAGAGEIEAGVRAELALHGLTPAQLKSIAVLATKRGAASLATVAERLGVALDFVSSSAASAASGRCRTSSPRSLSATGLPSASEAAALAAAGCGSHLIGARGCHGLVSCALAQCGNGGDIGHGNGHGNGRSNSANRNGAIHMDGPTKQTSEAPS